MTRLIDADDLESAAMPAGGSLLRMLLVGFCLAAFAGAATLGVMFAESLGFVGRVLIATAALFVVGLTVAGFAATRRGLSVAAVLVALACAGALYAAIDAGLQYGQLKRDIFAGRAGPRLVEPDSEPGRRMLSAMMASVAASLSAITALPILVYLILRAIRTELA